MSEENTNVKLLSSTKVIAFELSSLNKTVSSIENLINRLNADGNITYPDFKFNFFEDYANNTRTDTNS